MASAMLSRIFFNPIEFYCSFTSVNYILAEYRILRSCYFSDPVDIATLSSSIPCCFGDGLGIC